MPTLWVANDHAAFALKDDLVAHATDLGWHVNDLGAHPGDSVDYPDMADALATSMTDHSDDVGLLICGSGIGISIAANRHRHVRAALCNDVTSAKLCRQHNDANVICFGARLIGVEVARQALTAFLTQAFDGGRHQRRVDKLS